MSPELIEQLHRIEHKLDKIVEFFRLGETSVEDINASRVCPICEGEIQWAHNGEGQVTRKCRCDLKMKSIDFNTFAPPTQKGK